MAAPPSFMDTPLVTWVQTFSSQSVTYQDLFDGVFLNTVMHDIDQKCVTAGINVTVEDFPHRLQNWDVVLKNIKSYYKEVLQQMIVMRLPNIVTMSRNPESDDARNELSRVLLLVLGCAMQCEQKEYYIEKIKSLEVDVQHAIVEYIKEITDDRKNVFSIELPEEEVDEVSRNIFSHLQVLIQERDGYIEEIRDLTQSLEELYQTQQATQQELQARKSAGLSPGTPAPHGAPGSSTTPEKHHIATELAESKAKLRKVRQELEDKTEFITELHEDLEELRTVSKQLRSENLDLTQDARAARTYRDEVDILKEKANRVDKYELEISRYKEKLNELDFFKARTEELREDNQVLLETKNMLEDQLSATHKRVEAVLHMESELSQYKQQVEAITSERDFDREKIQHLLEKNARLEFEKKSSFNENSNLEDELVKARRQLNVGLTTSLSEQFSNSSHAQLLRLEQENQRLQEQLDQLLETTALETNTKLLELQKENLRLSTKVETLQQASSKDVEGALELEQKLLSLTRHKDQLEEAMDTVRENSQRQVNELERENDQLQRTIETLRERNEKTLDMRASDTEKENKRLHENVKASTAKVSQLEFENRQLTKSCNRLQSSQEKVQELEDELLKRDHEKEDFKTSIATLQLSCDKFEKLEQESSDLESDNKKLNKTVDNLQGTISRLKTIEQDNINLNVDTQHLRRTIETLKNSSTKLVSAEQEKHDLNEQIRQLQRTVETYKLEKSKQDQLESSLYDFDTENQKLQVNLEATTKKLAKLQLENSELDKANSKLQDTLRSSNLSQRKIKELEKELKDLEVENQTLQKDKSNIDKENRRLKQSQESRDASLDELTSQVSSLERENRTLQKLAERNDDVSEQLREAEQENMELLQRAGIDKRTVSTLREELVSEKLRVQQLNNDRKKLNHDLKKMGLDKEKIVIAAHTEGESKFQALESMMNETYRQTVEYKVEKIHALESRLDESKSRNVHLQDDLKSVKRQYEALQQCREEESLQGRASMPVDRGQATIISLQNSTKDILELKDHIISLERTNATLETETRNLRTQASSVQQRLDGCEKENRSLRSQTTSQQSQTTAIQSQLAKCQVDNTTVQSQKASLTSQNSKLQRACSKLEAERNRLLNDNEEILASRQELISDHEAIQQIHDQMSKEYDALISAHGSLKANYKSLKAVYDELVDENAALSREKMAVSQLKQIIEAGQKNMQSDTARLSDLQLEYFKLKEENIELQNASDKTTRKYVDLLSSHKALKQEHNMQKAKLNELEDQHSHCKERVAAMDIELNKLGNKCEMMGQLNVKLEEDNHELMIQIRALLTQNHDMLTTSLESKDQVAEEQKHYIEKVAELRRQKEKLEEKIMEQYKRYDPVKKKSRGFGANLMKKAKQTFSRSKSKDRSKSGAMGSGDISVIQDSGENSSLGSGSLGENLDATDRGRANPRKGRLSRHGNSNIRAEKKALAKSTTALNSLLSDISPNLGVGVGLRGARSSENLLADGPRRRDAADRRSTSTFDLRHPEWSSRPSRRRTLMDNSSSNLNTSDGFAAHGSLSSEDTPGSRSQELRLQDLSLTPQSARRAADTTYRAEDDEDDEDEDEDEEVDGKISLFEFLSEVDKSPKSRRKYIQKTIIEAAVDKKTLSDEAETSVLSPHLGPRSPLIEADDLSPTKLKARHWKSEMNITQMTRHHGSAFRTYDSRQNPPQPNSSEMRVPPQTLPKPSTDLTSTPYGVSSHRRNSDKVYSPERDGDRSYSNEGGLVTRLFDSSSQRPGDSKRHGSVDNGLVNGQFSGRSDTYGHASSDRHPSTGYLGSSGTRPQPQGQNHQSNMRPVSSLGIPIHDNTSPNQKSPPDYHGNHDRERSKTPSMLRQASGSSIGSANIGAYNAMTRQTSAGSTPQRPEPSHGDRSASRSLPRAPNNASHHPPYNNTSQDSLHNNNNIKYTSMDQTYVPGTGQRSLPRPPGVDAPTSGYPPPMRAINNAHHNTDNSQQYNPGNVHSVSQDYHQRQHLPTGSSPSQVPVAPPRRSRPMSAGPIGANTAFSLPQRSTTPGPERDRPVTPGGHEVLRPKASHPDSANRSLPATPSGPTAPRPQSGSAGAQPHKSHIYYDYGCV